MRTDNPKQALEFLSTPSARRATQRVRVWCCQLDLFLSTPSARRATPSSRPFARASANFYPRPPRGGRRQKHCKASVLTHFYPRPPRGGRRPMAASVSFRPFHFYPRPPRGGRQHFAGNLPVTCRFLSTPSARRATVLLAVDVAHGLISIHALREEGDRPAPSRLCRHPNFYPRPPRGGRPSAAPDHGKQCLISIHALREEGDD